MADNYCVMNMAKRHRADIRGLQAEANREYDDEEKYKGNVDLTKSGDNVYLVKSDDWHKSIDEALDGAGLKENRESVVLVTSVYDTSQDWFDSHTDEQRMEYFKKCLDFERKTKGQVISAVIHKDETRWHMHVASVPIVAVQDVECVKVTEKDENGQEQVVKDKAGRPKYKRYKKVDENGNAVMHLGLSAKTVFGNKVKMSKTQTQFWKECGESLGMKRGEIRIEDTEEAKERLTEAQHRAEKIKEQAEAEASQIKAQAVEEARKASKDVEEEKEALRLKNAEISKKEQELEIIKQTYKKATEEANTASQAYNNAKQSYEMAVNNVSMGYVPALKVFSEGVKVALEGMKYKDGTNAYTRFGFEDKLNRLYMQASEHAKKEVERQLSYRNVKPKEQAVQELEPLQEEKELEAFIKQEAEKQAQKSKPAEKKPEVEVVRTKPRQAVKPRPLPHTPTPQADNSDDYGLGK
jgi:hypothetical protein